MVFLNKPPNDDLYIEVGEYAYNFQIILPPNIPTRFDDLKNFSLSANYSLIFFLYLIFKN